MPFPISVSQPTPGSNPQIFLPGTANAYIMVGGTLPNCAGNPLSIQVSAVCRNNNQIVQGTRQFPAAGYSWQFQLPVVNLTGWVTIIVYISDPNGDSSIVIPVNLPAYHRCPDDGPEDECVKMLERMETEDAFRVLERLAEHGSEGMREAARAALKRLRKKREK
jgi:hypothetical protein